jgi:pyrimidine operon attenuation protein/uracil phosphoribosyltransferase
MIVKTKIMDEATINRTLNRITHEIIERNGTSSDLYIFGIKKNGVPIAKKLCENLKLFGGINAQFGELDITFKRDDISEEEKLLKATKSLVPSDINGKRVILVDDVLFTGRTVKAAIETLFGFGRPKSVQLVVLIDRGHRELPFRPDYIGKNVPTSSTETVVLNFGNSAPAGVFICDSKEEVNA